MKAMRMLFFRVRHDGIIKKTGRMALSRIMVVACKMRYFRLHGGGVKEEKEEEVKEDQSGGGAEKEKKAGEDTVHDEKLLVLMNCHLNNQTARKAISQGSNSLRRYFDEISRYIIKYGVRIMAADFNMALWMVVGELRARGVQANLASWYPFKTVHDTRVKMDSCAVLVIGGCMGCRMIYDCSVLGITPPERTNSWRNVDKVEKDEHGKEKRGPWPVAEFTKSGRPTGEPLSSYMPKTQNAGAAVLELHACTR